MTKGVFIIRSDSPYDDKPEIHYQFPAQYLSRASQFVGDWILYYEPTKAGARGYHAAAKVQQIVPDPTLARHFLALIEPGEYVTFERDVPFRMAGELVERGVLNEGAISLVALSQQCGLFLAKTSIALLQSASQMNLNCCREPERSLPKSKRHSMRRATELSFSVLVKFGIVHSDGGSLKPTIAGVP